MIVRSVGRTVESRRVGACLIIWCWLLTIFRGVWRRLLRLLGWSLLRVGGMWGGGLGTTWSGSGRGRIWRSSGLMWSGRLRG